MPIYEYECRECGHRFEVRQSVTEGPIAECEQCAGLVRKVFYPVGVIYKAGGFHITDYTRKNTKGSEDSHKPSSESSEAISKPAESASTASVS